MTLSEGCGSDTITFAARASAWLPGSGSDSRPELAVDALASSSDSTASPSDRSWVESRSSRRVNRDAQIRIIRGPPAPARLPGFHPHSPSVSSGSRSTEQSPGRSACARSRRTATAGPSRMQMRQLQSQRAKLAGARHDARARFERPLPPRESPTSSERSPPAPSQAWKSGPGARRSSKVMTVASLVSLPGRSSREFGQPRPSETPRPCNKATIRPSADPPNAVWTNRLIIVPSVASRGTVALYRWACSTESRVSQPFSSSRVSIVSTVFRRDFSLSVGKGLPHVGDRHVTMIPDNVHDLELRLRKRRQPSRCFHHPVLRKSTYECSAIIPTPVGDCKEEEFQRGLSRASVEIGQLCAGPSSPGPNRPARGTARHRRPEWPRSHWRSASLRTNKARLTMSSIEPSLRVGITARSFSAASPRQQLPHAFGISDRARGDRVDANLLRPHSTASVRRQPRRRGRLRGGDVCLTRGPAIVKRGSVMFKIWPPWSLSHAS